MIFDPSRAAGLEQLEAFTPRAGRRYADSRNHDDGAGRTNVSQLSPWLHAGLIREAEVVERVLEQHSAEVAEKFIAEVFWRVYFKGYLEQRPSIWPAYLAERDVALERVERNAGLASAYAQAIEGRTGIAAFDHWARELVETGYLHNHARMWFASIWIFTLKLDWQLGADFFLRHLLDGDAASNTLSWRWVGGLHTAGKIYLARADNIARYTANHPHGPLAAPGLADEAAPLTEAEDHPRKPLSLPPEPVPRDFAQPYALLLHDEGASHVPLALPRPPALVIGAARPVARSPQTIGTPASTFAEGAVASGMAEAARVFACPGVRWSPDGPPLTALLAETGLARIAAPHLATGWTRDALWPDLAPLAEAGRLIHLLAPLDRATWPHAKAGFFAVKKAIPKVLRETGIADTG